MSDSRWDPSLDRSVVHLDPQTAMFEAMLRGWGQQQSSRSLSVTTIRMRLEVVRRFSAYTQDWPWRWTAGDVEDWSSALRSGAGLSAQSQHSGPKWPETGRETRVKSGPPANPTSGVTAGQDVFSESQRGSTRGEGPRVPTEKVRGSNPLTPASLQAEGVGPARRAGALVPAWCPQVPVKGSGRVEGYWRLDIRIHTFAPLLRRQSVHRGAKARRRVRLL